MVAAATSTTAICLQHLHQVSTSTLLLAVVDAIRFTAAPVLMAAIPTAAAIMDQTVDLSMTMVPALRVVVTLWIAVLFLMVVITTVV